MWSCSSCGEYLFIELKPNAYLGIIFKYFIINLFKHTFVWGAQKNYLIEIVLLCTNNIYFDDT